MTQIVRVVPDVASFAVDDGFAYSVPDSIGLVEIGSIVRVPLSGRTVRGFVIDDDARSDRRLRAVKSVTGDYPVFDRRLLQTLRWAAIHYVSPLGPMLAKASPPNVPRRIEADPRAPVSAAASPLPKVTERVVAGGRLPAHA
ncbi:MAG: hypothetical protein HKN93_01155, partial [Acidimicrobiia bacterium]|nr:hypothetical protein [Acidimicrobiia bacterium]